MLVKIDGNRYKYSWDYLDGLGLDEEPIVVMRCAITILDDDFTASQGGEGVSKCLLRVDRFEKEFGRKASLTRALADAEFTRAERTILWKDYFARKNS